MLRNCECFAKNVILILSVLKFPVRLLIGESVFLNLNCSGVRHVIVM